MTLSDIDTLMTSVLYNALMGLCWTGIQHVAHLVDELFNPIYEAYDHVRAGISEKVGDVQDVLEHYACVVHYTPECYWGVRASGRHDLVYRFASFHLGSFTTSFTWAWAAFAIVCMYIAATVSLAVVLHALRLAWRRYVEQQRAVGNIPDVLASARDGLPTLATPTETTNKVQIEEPSAVAELRSMDDIRPNYDEESVARRRIGPVTKRMLAMIRLRFGVPTYSVANEEMIRRFIISHADVYRGMREAHLVPWVASTIALSFIPSNHELELRRELTGTSYWWQVIYDKVTGRRSTHQQISEFNAMVAN